MDRSIDHIYLELGHNIRRFRKSLKLNQEEFGSKVGLSRVSIANIENGKQRPTIHFFFDILIIFRIDINEIFPFDKLKQEQDKQKLEEKPKVNKFIKELES